MAKPNPIFLRLLCASGIPAPETELLFARPRKWRFDYAWPEYRLALEVEGGVWTGGRHTRPTGFLGDIEKYNCATKLGWRLIRATPKDLISSETVALIQACLKH